MSLGKSLRMRRLNRRGRMVIVAVDHGNAAGVVPGLDNTPEIVGMCDRAGADAVLITPGMLELCAEQIGDLGVVLRIDGAVTTAGPGGPMRVFCEVDHATALGVDAVVLNATVGAPYESAELEKIGRIASEGRRWGMPVVAEVLSQRMLSNHMDFQGSGRDALPEDIASDVAMCCRLGAELGADAIKTRFCGDVEAFRRIVASSGRPVLVAGGPMRGASLDATLHLVNDVLEAGAAGVVFGRQIWQQPDPGAALRAVCAMVHEDATVAEALDLTAA
jgi:DhnA family fructose-bisphosphate aldolase class Ia